MPLPPTPAASSHMNNPTNRDVLILETKTFIQKLSRIQQREFQILSDRLGLVFEKGYDPLFDYVYNCDNELSFDEFLKQFNNS